MGLTDSDWRALGADDGQLFKMGTPLSGVGLHIAPGEPLGLTLVSSARREPRCLLCGLHIDTGERLGMTRAAVHVGISVDWHGGYK